MRAPMFNSAKRLVMNSSLILGRLSFYRRWTNPRLNLRLRGRKISERRRLHETRNMKSCSSRCNISGRAKKPDRLRSGRITRFDPGLPHPFPTVNTSSFPISLRLLNGNYRLCVFFLNLLSEFSLPSETKHLVSLWILISSLIFPFLFVTVIFMALITVPSCFIVDFGVQNSL